MAGLVRVRVRQRLEKAGTQRVCRAGRGSNLLSVLHCSTLTTAHCTLYSWSSTTSEQSPGAGADSELLGTGSVGGEAAREERETVARTSVTALLDLHCIFTWLLRSG